MQYILDIIMRDGIIRFIHSLHSPKQSLPRLFHHLEPRLWIDICNINDSSVLQYYDDEQMM